MSKRVGVTYRERDRVAPYEEALRSVGIEPVLISPDDSATLEGIDGLLVTGGTDVNPKLYGQAPHAETDAPDDARDQLESGLLESALDRDLPVLAICRGMQLFNVVHGGTLEQHIDSHRKHRVGEGERCAPAHRVAVESGSVLAQAVGEGEMCVNSRHHQAVADVGDGLVVSARDAEDGMVEALERPDKRFAVAVQWHPEDQASRDAVQKRLFEKFAEAL